MDRESRFPLEMKKGVLVNTIDELLNNFSLKRVLYYIETEEMYTWLSSRYLEDMAQELLELNKTDLDYNKKVCDVFLVEYNSLELLEDNDNENLELTSEEVILSDDAIEEVHMFVESMTEVVEDFLENFREKIEDESIDDNNEFSELDYSDYESNLSSYSLKVDAKIECKKLIELMIENAKTSFHDEKDRVVQEGKEYVCAIKKQVQIFLKSFVESYYKYKELECGEEAAQFIDSKKCTFDTSMITEIFELKDLDVLKIGSAFENINRMMRGVSFTSKFLSFSSSNDKETTSETKNIEGDTYNCIKALNKNIEEILGMNDSLELLVSTLYDEPIKAIDQKANYLKMCTFEKDSYGEYTAEIEVVVDNINDRINTVISNAHEKFAEQVKEIYLQAVEKYCEEVKNTLQSF